MARHRSRFPRALAMGALLLALVPAGAAAQGDLTRADLPHTADSVIFDLIQSYGPSNVSNEIEGLANGAWHSGDDRTGDSFPHWVQVDLGQPFVVRCLHLLVYSEAPDSDLRLRDFELHGSDDGVAFTPLHGAPYLYENRHEWQSFTFGNDTAYRYYRLVGLSNWCTPLSLIASQMIIEEWRMFESETAPGDHSAWGDVKSLYR